MKSIISHTVTGGLLFGTALFPAVVSGKLGINCNGSGLCSGGQDTNLSAMRDKVKNVDPNRVFYDGEHIACSALINVLVATVANCVFVQGTGGKGVRGSDIPPLMDALVSHGCGICGSVPAGLVNQKDNNPDDFGMLTVNAVSNPQCLDALCVNTTEDIN